MLSVVKMPLKGVVVGCALNGHGNYILILENHGNVFLNFCGNNKDWLGFVTKSFLKKMLACHKDSN